jgi:hypothetical protein
VAAPEREPVDDQSQGVQLATMQELANYWATEWDWRRCEAKLNPLDQFVTTIDGLDIHFIHVRTPHEDRNCCPRSCARRFAHCVDTGAARPSLGSSG